MHEPTSYPASGNSATSTVSNTPVVSLDRVTKRFGSLVALRNVSLQINLGDVYGLLGPNGAGKSTLLKLLLGFLYPDKGTIKLFGSSNLTRAHARLGCLPEEPRSHGNFTGREELGFRGPPSEPACHSPPPTTSPPAQHLRTPRAPAPPLAALRLQRHRRLTVRRPGASNTGTAASCQARHQALFTMRALDAAPFRIALWAA